jgi:hypothetical protein
MARYSTKKPSKKASRLGFAAVFLALAGLLLVLATGWALLGGSQPKTAPAAAIEVHGAPRLKIEKAVIDHGDVKLGTPIRDEVKVTNIGDQPLRFTKAPTVEVKEGC